MTPTPNPPALLPCPFCGAAPIVTGYNAPEVWVTCETVGCKASSEGFLSQDLAVAAWNRRAPLSIPAEPKVSREALRRALEQNIGVGMIDARLRDAIIANVMGAATQRAGLTRSGDGA